VMYRTVSDPGTMKEYLRLLALMPEWYRKFVIIEICEIPSATTPMRLGELSKILGQFAKGLSLELPLEYPRLAAILEQSPWAVAVSLVGANASNAQLSAKLRNFVVAAANTGTPTLAHSASSIGMATAAVEAGFTYIDGPAIHTNMREPKPPSALNPLQAAMTPATIAARLR
ncbi:MAG: hypothetical protein JWN11_621, partial [Hyphomicrobiales bacterium]|nr:hypothetical protein [Hyphomicrobiales bacterium]